MENSPDNIEIIKLDADFLISSLSVNATKFPIKCLIMKDYYSIEKDEHSLSIIDEVSTEIPKELTFVVLPLSWFSNETRRNSLQTKIINFVKTNSQSYVDLTEKLTLRLHKVGLSMNELIEEFISFFVKTIMRHVEKNTFYRGFGRHGFERQYFKEDIINESYLLHEIIWNSNVIFCSQIKSYEMFTEHIIEDLKTIWKLMFIKHTLHGYYMNDKTLNMYRDVDLNLSEHILESALLGESTMTHVTQNRKYSLDVLAKIYDHIIIDKHLEICREFQKYQVEWSLAIMLKRELSKIIKQSILEGDQHNFKLKNIMIADDCFNVF